MTKPSGAESDHGVDQKLDSLISRIQLLGGEGKRPKQASRPTAVDPNSEGEAARGESGQNVGESVGESEQATGPSEAVAPTRNTSSRAAPRNAAPRRAAPRNTVPRQVWPVRSGH